MDIRSRLIMYMLCFNVLPKASGLNEARYADLYYINWMYYGNPQEEKIPLPALIIHQMKQVVASQQEYRNFCFPLIPCGNAHTEFTHSRDILDVPTLGRLGYHLVQGVWALRKKKKVDELEDKMDRIKEEASAEVVTTAIVDVTTVVGTSSTGAGTFR
ncbi:hypothetical protein Ancab_001973 [Ancistrocladus abbreviatus]